MEVRLEIPPALIKALGTDLNKEVVQPAAWAWAQQVKRIMVVYPPSSEANIPNAKGRWYQRGYGPRWQRRDGSIGGRKTSELLNRSWGVFRATYGAWVGSRASYSPFVHSAAEQTRAHAARKWKTDERALEEAKPAFQAILDSVMKKVGLG